VGHGPAGHVARADDQVGPRLQLGQQRGQGGGVVGEVGVDLDDHVGTTVDGPPEPVAVRRPETPAAGPHEHVDAAELGVEAPGHVGGAVGAVVVDDEHADAGHGLAQQVDELGEVLGLVVRRHHGHDLHGAEDTGRP